jgi:uncharacterized phage protein (TIGR01671 family)
MREIKFRAWDKKNNKMVDRHKRDEEDMDESYCDHVACRLGGIEDLQTDKEWRDRFEVIQYTGLKDKNGKEIYEGDIVMPEMRREYRKEDYTIGNCIVEWDDDIIGFYPFCDYDIDCGDYYPKEHCQVIGNIYENPELLERDK